MKQPVHICMKDNRLVYRSSNGVNGNLIFQSVPRCPTVPTHRTWDNGTGRDGNNFIEK
jgi:hypothetical protein